MRLTPDQERRLITYVIAPYLKVVGWVLVRTILKPKEETVDGELRQAARQIDR
jgi:hypothetical protein